MTIRYQCEECGSVLNIKDEKAGTTGHCPKCKAEFLIPTPERGSAVATSEGGAGGHGQRESSTADPAVQRSKMPRPIARRGDMDSDEIEQILEAKGDSRSEDDYGKAGGDVSEDETDADDTDSPLGLQPAKNRTGGNVDDEVETDWDGGDEEVDEEGERPQRKARRGHEKVEPAGSAAGIAQGLMARGDKALKFDRDDRHGGRAFGGREGEEDDDEGFTLKERVAYFARYLVPAAVGIAIAVGFYMWWLSGWQKGDLPELGTVSGIITIDNAPLANAMVQFHPMQTDPQKEVKASSSIGFTDANGQYLLLYTNNAQGAVLGKHRVEITDASGGSQIPAHYNTQTTLTHEVKSGSNSGVDFKLSSAKLGGSGAAGGFSRPGQ